MLQRNPFHREILGQFWERLDIVQDNQDWPILEEPVVRRIPDNVPNMLDDLAEEFGCDELTASGIADQDDDGALMPSAGLVSGESVLLLASEAGGGTAFDALLPQGILLGDELPAYAVAHDVHTISAIGSSDGLVVVVPTFADLVTCRALGLAAVPIFGMENCTLNELRQIEELAGTPDPLLLPTNSDSVADEEAPAVGAETVADEESQTAPEADGHEPEQVPSEHGADVVDLVDFSAELIVAGWSFTRQQRVPEEQTQRVLTRLANAERFLPIDLSRVAVWVPTEQDMEAIRFCWELRDRSQVARAVVDGIGRASYSISAAISADVAPWHTPVTYLEARSALWRSLRNTPIDSADHRAVVDRCDYLLQCQLIDPLLEAGVANADPILGTLRIELANISSLLQSQAPFLQYELLQASIQSESRDRRAVLDRNLRQRMQLVDRLVDIVRELRR